MLKDRLFLIMMFGAVMLGAMTGCRKDNDKPEAKPQPEPTERVAVNLRADILPTSPGINRSVANDQWEADDKVGLFMKRAGQALTASGAIYGDANNLQTSIVNGSLTAATAPMYPMAGNVDFIAYHPYQASVGAGFTIPVNVAEQEAGLPVEVLYSNNITNQQPTEQAVTLNFQYSLAKVEIIVTGGANSELTAADFDAMTVTVQGLPTQATLNLANGTLSGVGEKQSITLHRKSHTSTSAMFEMLALPADEAVTFIFNAAGKLTMHETTVTYEAAKLYRTTFALYYPEVVKHTTYIAPRGEEPPQNISISAGTRYMTMTTAEPVVGIYLGGTGNAFVDWGDGSQLETFTLEPYNIGDYIYDTPRRYTHSYIGTTARTIIIYGDDITLLACGQWQSGSQWISNQLTALDVSNNTALTILHCNYNQLTVLDVSNNRVLTDLRCLGNQLTALDVSNNTALNTLRCQNNQLTATALNDLFGTLHSNPPLSGGYMKNIRIFGNPGTETCDQSIATAKGWEVDTTSQYN